MVKTLQKKISDSLKEFDVDYEKFKESVKGLLSITDIEYLYAHLTGDKMIQ